MGIYFLFGLKLICSYWYAKRSSHFPATDVNKKKKQFTEWGLNQGISIKPLYFSSSKNNSISSRGGQKLAITQRTRFLHYAISYMSCKCQILILHLQHKIKRCVLNSITSEEHARFLQHDAYMIKVQKWCADNSPMSLGPETGSRATRGSWDGKQHLVIMHSLIPRKCHALL